MSTLELNHYPCVHLATMGRFDHLGTTEGFPPTCRHRLRGIPLLITRQSTPAMLFTPIRDMLSLRIIRMHPCPLQLALATYLPSALGPPETPDGRTPGIGVHSSRRPLPPSGIDVLLLGTMTVRLISSPCHPKGQGLGWTAIRKSKWPCHVPIVF